jgi:hypothetical protein|nr:MAG TPA: tail fiber protein [Caudoviricetes sp.]
MAVGKKITDLTASGSLKDTDLAIVHDGKGTKRSTLTQLGEYMGTKFSNPNLLINPDFRINQRRQTSYKAGSTRLYTVDRWHILDCSATVLDGGLTVQSNNGGWLAQKLEKAVNGVATLSIKISEISGKLSFADSMNDVTITSAGVYSITLSNVNQFSMYLHENTSATIEWAKLEKGSIATPFVAPNPAEELVKCRRYYNFIASHFYGVANPNGFINEDLVSFRNFRINPTIDIKATYSSGVTESTLTLKGTNINGYYLYGRTRSTGDYALDVTIIADAEIY